MGTQQPTLAQSLNEIIQFGRSLTLCGADVRVVETTLEALGRRFGAQDMNVFVISSAIVITGHNESGDEKTQSIRIVKKISYDFTKLQNLAQLAERTLQDETITLEEFTERRKLIDGLVQAPLISYIGSMLGAGGFAIFFGGHIVDGLAAACIGIIFCYLTHTIRNWCPNDIVFNFIACFVAGSCIHILHLIFPILMVDMITIGVIMLPIPGIPITNSVRDMISGDIITGILRFVESLLITAGIAAGFIASLTIFSL